MLENGKTSRTISNKAIANYGLRLNRFSISATNSEEKRENTEEITVLVVGANVV